MHNITLSQFAPKHTFHQSVVPTRGLTHGLFVDTTSILDVDSLYDFVDMFFGGRDVEFKIVVLLGEPPNEAIRGSCAPVGGVMHIKLWMQNIATHSYLGLRLGGNSTLARDPTHGAYLVLAHELRHAYQSLYHKLSESSFNAGKYMGRASEVDARRFVDENYNAICAFIDVSPSPIQVPSLSEQLVRKIYDDVGQGFGAPSVDGLWDIIMEMPGNPDTNFNFVETELTRLGICLLPA